MNSPQNNKAGWYFALLLAIFAGPMIVAWAMYNWNSFIPEALPNGHLIQPPLALQQLPLSVSDEKKIAHNWHILYLNPNLCKQSCQDTLYKIRQIRTALGKEAPRVDRIIITLAEQTDANLQQLLTTDYQGTIHITATTNDLRQFLQPLPSKSLALTQGYLYLADPLGNIMMSYPATTKPKGIFNDLKKLLKTSQIG